MRFEDRKDAALKLCQLIKEKGYKVDVIVGILRGGGYMAKVMGEILGVPWGVLPIKKISTPEAPESGFGAVTYDGTYAYDLEYAKLLGLEEEDVEKILKLKLSEAIEQFEIYKDFVIENFEGKKILLVDDGMATGYSAIVGAKYIRNKNPKRLYLAIPVSSQSSVEFVKEYFDEIFCLEKIKSVFFAVGMFYENFEQISDFWLLKFLRGCSFNHP